MDYGQLWAALRRGWLLVLLLLVTGLALSVLYLRTATPEFTARSTVYVSAVGGVNVTELSSGAGFAQSQARNFSLIVTRDRVLNPVIKQLGLTESVASLGNSISATVPSQTSVIVLEVTRPSPQAAAAIADAVAQSLTETAADLLPPAKRGAAAIRLETVERAQVPTSPSSPSVLVATAVGLALGLLAGVVAALALQSRRAQQAARSAESRSADPVPVTDDARSRQAAESWSWAGTN